MNQPLQESIDNLVEATSATDQEHGVLEVEFITPGWGSSGYYSPDVVEAAAPLFAAGTQMFFDHPKADGSDIDERGNRSVRDLAATIVEGGRIDKQTGGIVGKVKPFAPYRDLLLDENFAKNIGLSMRASATDISEGEAEGKRGLIIEGLTDLKSVDFVTRAGRGGRVRQVLESGMPDQVNRRAIKHGVEEATADERRTQLSDAVRSQYGGTDRYAWVQDFDDTTVWFQESPDNDRARYWAQSYTAADDDMTVTLTGERTEVRPVTRYLPVGSTATEGGPTDPPATRPGSTTTESEEDTSMGNIQIEESEHQRLTEAAGRVTVLESERDQAIAERDQARGELAESTRISRARTMISESDTSYDRLQTAGLLVDLPTTTEGALDEAAFTTRLTEAAAQLAEARGAGRVSGFGTEVDQGDEPGDPAKIREESDKVRRGAFGHAVDESKGA